MILSTLSNRELKDIFWEPDMLFKDNRDWKWSIYFRHIKQYFQTVIRKNGSIRNEYRFGRYNYDGRLYTLNGNGLQTFQNKLRNYVSGEYYKDIDIKNAHPSILLFLCDKYNINSIFLKRYVEERTSVLTETGLKKLDFLIAINSDVNKLKRNNTFFNSLIVELDLIKNQLISNITDEGLVMDNTNENNPKSSQINKLLCKYENEIIQKAIQYFGNENIGVPMFDGLMINKETEFDLEELNELFTDYKYITFTEKSTHCDIVIEETEFTQDSYDYDDVKALFEKEYFLVSSPYSYWKKSRELDNTFSYKQITKDSLKDACEEFKIINSDNKLVSIHKTWIGDKDKKKFDNIVFEPYGKENNCPSFSYNTFSGFRVNNIQDYEEDVDISNFKMFISCLCNEYNKPSTKITDWLMKYLAHMFQYPNERPDSIVLFTGWTGAGKDTLYLTLKNLLGGKYIDNVGDLEEVFGQFNSVLNNKICLFMNEMEGIKTHKHQERLKELTTKEYHNINIKNEKTLKQKNFIRIFGASNGQSPMNIQVNDRRIRMIKTGFNLITRTSDKNKRNDNIDFFTNYYQSLQNPKWLKSVYKFLMNIDLSNYDVKNELLQTEDYLLLKSKNINTIYKYLQHLIEDDVMTQSPEFIEKDIDNQTVHFITFKDFKELYTTYQEENFPDLEFKYKDLYIKQLLNNMNDSYLLPKKMRYTEDGEVKRATLMGFKFSKVKAFLDNYVYYNEGEEEEIDLGEI